MLNNRVALGLIGVFAVAGAIFVWNPFGRKSPEKTPYQHLQVKDCPGNKGIEAVFRHGSRDALGYWHLKIATESVTFKPPADCWTWITGVPVAYDKGDRIRFVDPAASGSAK